jgi:hypothetical protein
VRRKLSGRVVAERTCGRRDKLDCLFWLKSEEKKRENESSIVVVVVVVVIIIVEAFAIISL